MAPAGNALAIAPVRSRARVIEAYDPRPETTGICLSAGYGARLDPPGRRGIARFLEHLLFSLPAGGHPSIAEHVERLAGYVNAETGLETMLLELRTKVEPGSRRLARTLAALPKAPGSPATRSFRRLAVARTRRRELIGLHLCAELLCAQVAADPSDLVQDVVFARLFPGHPFSRPVGGRIGELRALTPAEIEQAHREHFPSLPRALVVVCPRPVDGLVERLGAPTSAHGTAVPDPPALPEPDLTLPVPAPYSELSRVCLAGPPDALDATGPGQEAPGVPAGLLGSSPSSLLYRRPRGEEALSHSFEDWSFDQARAALLAVTPERVAEAAARLRGNLAVAVRPEAA